jgi:uncharacterized membrane protein YfcA
MNPIFWTTALLAAILGTIASFGISTILLPVAVQTYTYQNALAITAIFHLFGNLGRMQLATTKINKKITLRFGAPAVAATIIGATAINHIPPTTGKTILAAILITYSTLSLLNIEPKIPPTTTNTITGGAAYGLLSGLAGTGGPLRGSLLLGLGLEKEEYIATSGAISLLIDLTRVPTYLLSGYLDPQYYTITPLLLIVALAGSTASKHLIKTIKPGAFRKTIQAAVLLMGLKILADTYLP